MTSSTARPLDLEALTLQSGSHSRPEDGLCVMEAVAFMAGEPHSDMPACVSPVLRRMGMRLNDRLDDERRQDLKDLVPRLIGTNDDGLDAQRQALATTALMRDWLPAWLRLAGLPDAAAQAEAGHDPSSSELRKALAVIREEAWQARANARRTLRQKIRAELLERGAAAAADAAAAAAADAAAAAAAAADAAADAAVAALAAALADRWDSIYSAVYRAMREHYETSPALAEVRSLRDKQTVECIALFERMIDPSAPAVLTPAVGA